MWPRRQPSRWEGVNYLDLVPRRLVEYESAPDGCIAVRMPRYRDCLFGRILQPLLRGDRRFIRVPLEDRGSWIWQRVDGRNTVGEIAREFRASFPEETEEVETRVCQYVAAMVGHGFLAV